VCMLLSAPLQAACAKSSRTDLNFSHFLHV